MTADSSKMNAVGSILQSIGGRWLSLNEASEYTGLCARTLRRRIQEGVLAYGKAGRNIRLKQEALDAMLQSGAVLVKAESTRKFIEQQVRR